MVRKTTSKFEKFRVCAAHGAYRKFLGVDGNRLIELGTDVNHAECALISEEERVLCLLLRTLAVGQRASAKEVRVGRRLIELFGALIGSESCASLQEFNGNLWKLTEAGGSTRKPMEAGPKAFWAKLPSASSLPAGDAQMAA